MSKKVVVMVVCVLILSGVFGVSADGKVTITFSTWGTPQVEGPSISAQLEAFSKKYPEIEVKWEMIPFNDYEPKVKTRIAAGEPYDVFWLATEFGPRSFLEKGTVLNLQPYVDKELEKDSAFFVTKYPQGVKENISKEGNIYFLAFLGDSDPIYFNKDLFDQAGVSYPPQTWQGTEESSWNLEAFLQTAQKLTKRSPDGRTEVYGYGDFVSIINLESLVHRLGDDPELIPSGSEEVLIDTPNARTALQFIYDLRKKYKVAPGIEELPPGGDDLWRWFQAEKVAMATMWSAHTLAFKDVNFNWDLALQPMDKLKGGLTWHSYMAISSNCKELDAAWELVKFLCGPEGQSIAAGFGFEAPLFEDSSVYESYLNATPKANRSVILENMQYSHTRWPIMGAMEIYRLFNDELLQKLLLDQLSVDDVINEAKDRTKEIINTYK